MNITIISLVFPPETGSARRVGELSFFLAERGHHVSIITGFPSYPKGIIFDGYKRTLFKKSRWKDMADLYRVYLYTSPKRKQFAHRLMHYLTFMCSSSLGGFLARKPDIVYVVSPPYFLGLSGYIISKISGAKLALDVQDFWPEAPIALGYIRNKSLIKFLRGMEKFIYDHCDVIFALSDVMKKKIVDRGIEPEKIERVYNWVDLSRFTPTHGEEIRDQFNLKGKFVVLFAGNMGQAQGLDAVLDAARLLKKRSDIVIALLGDGIELQRLEEKARFLALSNVLFLNAVPEDKVAPYLGMADVLLATLGYARHREAAVPSKIQVYMASEKPILVAAKGAAAQVVQEANCGLAIPPDDPVALSEAILKLRAMTPESLKEKGSEGRVYAKRHFELVAQCSLIESRLSALLDEK